MRQRLFGVAALLSIGCGGAAPARPDRPEPHEPPEAATQTCLQLGCASSLVVPLETAGPMKPGNYTFHVLFEGRDVECRATIPLGNAAPCSDPRVRLEVQGAGRPLSEQRVSALRITPGPYEAAVDIRRDVDVAAQIGLRPQWPTVPPGVLGCPAVCNAPYVRPIAVR